MRREEGGVGTWAGVVDNGGCGAVAARAGSACGGWRLWSFAGSGVCPRRGRIGLIFSGVARLLLALVWLFLLL